MELNVIFE